MSTASASPPAAAAGISSSHAARTQSSRDRPVGDRVAREQRHASRSAAPPPRAAARAGAAGARPPRRARSRSSALSRSCRARPSRLQGASRTRAPRRRSASASIRALRKIPPSWPWRSRYETPARRASNSSARQPMNGRCTWQSTNPGTIVPSSTLPSVTGSEGGRRRLPTNTIVPSSSHATPPGENTAAVAATPLAGSGPRAVASVAATAAPRAMSGSLASPPRGEGSGGRQPRAAVRPPGAPRTAPPTRCAPSARDPRARPPPPIASSARVPSRPASRPRRRARRRPRRRRRRGSVRPPETPGGRRPRTRGARSRPASVGAARRRRTRPDPGCRASSPASGYRCLPLRSVATLLLLLEARRRRLRPVTTFSFSTDAPAEVKAGVLILPVFQGPEFGPGRQGNRPPAGLQGREAHRQEGRVAPRHQAERRPLRGRRRPARTASGSAGISTRWRCARRLAGSRRRWVASGTRPRRSRRR